MKESGRIKTTADRDSADIKYPGKQSDHSTHLEVIGFSQYGLILLALPFLVIALIVWALYGLLRQQIGRANNLSGANMDWFSPLPFTIQGAVLLMIGIVLLRLTAIGFSSMIEERIRALVHKKVRK